MLCIFDTQEDEPRHMPTHAASPRRLLYGRLIRAAMGVGFQEGCLDDYYGPKSMPLSYLISRVTLHFTCMLEPRHEM